MSALFCMACGEDKPEVTETRIYCDDCAGVKAVLHTEILKGAFGK